jgi:RNA polymerase sigma factor (sigma-70 family)
MEAYGCAPMVFQRGLGYAGRMLPTVTGHAVISPGAAESELVAGLIAGQEKMVVAFLERTHHAVYCMAGRFTHDAGQRRDWCHEVLLGILDDLRRRRFTYTRPGCFWAWFRKRAYYRLVDQYRLQRRQWERLGAEPNAPPVDLESLAGSDDPGANLERAEIRATLEACLDKLPSVQQRRALEMRLFEELDYQSIADALAAPLNTAKAWIRRARIAVRKCVAHALNLQAERFKA